MVGLARSARKAASFVVHMDQDLSVWFTESIWVCNVDDKKKKMVGFCFINLGFSFLVHICIYIYHVIIFKKIFKLLNLISKPMFFLVGYGW